MKFFLYAVLGGEKIEREVSKEEYVSAERSAGFRNTLGQPNEPATASWSKGNTGGRIEYDPRAVDLTYDPGNYYR